MTAYFPLFNSSVFAFSLPYSLTLHNDFTRQPQVKMFIPLLLGLLLTSLVHDFGLKALASHINCLLAPSVFYNSPSVSLNSQLSTADSEPKIQMSPFFFSPFFKLLLFSVTQDS